MFCVSTDPAFIGFISPYMYIATFIFCFKGRGKAWDRCLSVKLLYKCLEVGQVSH